MSMIFYGQNDLRPVRRLVWGRLFGQFIQSRTGRRRAIRSRRPPAGRDGDRPPGRLSRPAAFPRRRHSCAPMADALEFSYDKIAIWPVLCQGAWEQ